MNESLYLSLGASVLALVFGLFLARQLLSEDEGTDKMKEIGELIQEGAAAFLKREYTFIAMFVGVVVVAIAVLVDFDAMGKFGAEDGELTDLPRTAIAYLLGAVASASAGYIGMFIAVRANTRTTARAREGLNPALRVAFSSGGVMGIIVTGLSLLCITGLYAVFQSVGPLAGFAFGALDRTLRASRGRHLHEGRGRRRGSGRQGGGGPR